MAHPCKVQKNLQNYTRCLQVHTYIAKYEEMHGEDKYQIQSAGDF